MPGKRKEKTDYVVLVTGAGSGMGEETAVFLSEQGYLVYGSVLSDEEGNALSAKAAERGCSIHVVKMDVTQPATIEDVIAEIMSKQKHIDALVNFAGIGLRGFFEDLSPDEIQNVFDINVFGSMAVTRAILPHMRKAKAGRILLTTSVAGRMGTMSISGYASSKFAVEGFAECLAQEVAPFGVSVSLLEPGLISTPHFTKHRNRARQAINPDSIYYPWFCQHEHIVDSILRRNSFTTHDVALKVEKILTAPKQKLRYIIGNKAKIIFFLRRYIPGDIFERVYFWGTRRLVVTPKTPHSRLD